MPVRSAKLASGASGGANVNLVIYTTPPGVTTIVKDIRCAANFGGGTSLNVGILSGGVTTWIFATAITDPTTTAGTERWCVLEPGDHLTIFSTRANAWAYYISGTELEGVAP